MIKTMLREISKGNFSHYMAQDKNQDKEFVDLTFFIKGLQLLSYRTLGFENLVNFLQTCWSFIVA